MPLGQRSKGCSGTESGALLNERENEIFFCLLSSVVCIATVMSWWGPEWEKEVTDLSQSEKGCRKFN